MNIILLSGGSGKRLWPLSNDIRSKQFIKIFHKHDCDFQMGTEVSDFESMVQRVYRQIKTVDPESKVTIATSKSQISAIHNQLGEDITISVEPCRRDTFPAIALATAFLHDVQGVPEDEAIVVCPVDPYVEDSYYRCIKEMCKAAQRGESNLVLMGIKPTYPSEKYGYIKPVSDANSSIRYTFTEKPTKEKAEEYIQAGALWNGGVFAYKISYLLNKAKEIIGFSDYKSLFSNYPELTKISFDYAVAEKEESIFVQTYSGIWKDLGTWNTLTEAMEENTIGNVQLNDSCTNVHVINELGIPILGMGVHNVVISASPEGILVSDKEESSYIKPYVDGINQQIMFAEKSWGSYRVLDVEEDSLTVKVTLNAHCHMNYHSHEKRDEVWTVVSGTGKAIVDGQIIDIKPGSVIPLPAGCKHMVITESPLIMIEVQIGGSISVKDKTKWNDEQNFFLSQFSGLS